MKRVVLLSFTQLIVGLCFSCRAENQLSFKNIVENSNSMNGNKIKIKVSEKTFMATLSDNPTTIAFTAFLPLKIKMTELNNNEKYADLSKSLPINPSVPVSIQSGDLMMYGSRTLVLFYKSFSTSYSYTKIGKIDDVIGLVEKLGSDDIEVSFEF